MFCTNGLGVVGVSLTKASYSVVSALFWLQLWISISSATDGGNRKGKKFCSFDPVLIIRLRGS